MHGLNGEDGTLQGMLELSGIPYTSPGVLASAVSMDKIAAKLFLNGLGVKTVPWAWFDKAEFQTVDGYKKILASVEKLKYPIIVKPSNLGSSIGISVCRNRTELCAALDVALEFDNRILCERALKDITEINCSVLGFANEAAASQCEQPIKWQEVLSFSDKYLKGGKNKGMSAMTRKLPAPIEDEKALYIRETSQKIFLALAAKGVIRIDFIIDGGGQIFVNEINTIPGSLSGYLWEHEGMTFGELIGKLIEYAEADRARKKCLNYAYESNVLNNAGGAKL
jgi:D-alanine-D-alanine ligase